MSQQSWGLSEFPCGVGFAGGSDSENLPTGQETWVRSLGWEDPLEEAVATHSSIHLQCLLCLICLEGPVHIGKKKKKEFRDSEILFLATYFLVTSAFY